MVPPGFGIVHQVNLEYLARGVHKTADDVYYPDTLVGTPLVFRLGTCCRCQEVGSPFVFINNEQVAMDQIAIVDLLVASVAARFF